MILDKAVKLFLGTVLILILCSFDVNDSLNAWKNDFVVNSSLLYVLKAQYSFKLFYGASKIQAENLSLYNKPEHGESINFYTNVGRWDSVKFLNLRSTENIELITPQNIDNLIVSCHRLILMDSSDKQRKINLSVRDFNLAVDSTSIRNLQFPCHTNFEAVRDISRPKPFVEFKHCGFQSLDLKSKSGILLFQDVTFDSTSILYIRDTCILKSIGGIGSVVLRGISVPNNNTSIAVFLNDIDVSQFKFPLSGVNVFVDTAQPYSAKLKIYSQLMELYKDVPESYERYDIAKRHLINQHEGSWIEDFVLKNWNNYGYSRWLIFRNSFFLLALAVFLNYMCYSRLIRNGFVSRELTIVDYKLKRKYGRNFIYHIIKIYYCAIYTSLIFWGFKLDFDKIKLRKIELAVLTLVQYVVGIICLGFIAHIIAT